MFNGEFLFRPTERQERELAARRRRLLGPLLGEEGRANMKLEEVLRAAHVVVGKVKPGETLIIGFHAEWTDEQMYVATQRIQEWLPGVKIVLIPGVSNMAIAPSGEVVEDVVPA